MTWLRVKWSEANQVLDLLAVPQDRRAPAAIASPAEYFALLRGETRRQEAAEFLAQALPRLEAVAWAARTVRDATAGGAGGHSATRALRVSLLWVQDPSENRRRAAFEAAQACRYEGAEAFAAMAVFFSGGSIAPASAPAVPPPKGVSGRFSALAVKLAALRADDRDAALDRALDAGAALAQRGLSASA